MLTSMAVLSFYFGLKHLYYLFKQCEAKLVKERKCYQTRGGGIRGSDWVASHPLPTPPPPTPHPSPPPLFGQLEQK